MADTQTILAPPPQIKTHQSPPEASRAKDALLPNPWISPEERSKTAQADFSHNAQGPI